MSTTQEQDRRPGARARWLRGGLAAGCALSFAVLGAVATSRWDGFVGVLLGTPRPLTPAAPITFPGPTAAERALSEARARLARGDEQGALDALARVAPHEPVYPLARQLQQQARAAAQGGR